MTDEKPRETERRNGDPMLILGNGETPELRAAAEAEKRYQRWAFLWSFWWEPLIDRIVKRRDRKSPAWDFRHYDDWSRDELVWRIVFLQGAGRRTWIEREAFRLIVLPVSTFVAFAVGMLLR